ncbi:Isoflavone reductase-like protein IRL [Colletotrichum sidae]|uniref:Isoflavone reductase-like protein IRL n=1 Tax=Colletotrichum sidae TaxID=1347389 RepID=A0A4R8T946_9PEZI|nr:Isoflavone reductase-like protein IRL [Colletotrichum sidae]
MSINRIAVYGHRGWASSAIVDALLASGAPVRVLYRPGSDISALPVDADCVQVDVKDEPALISALRNIDMVISLVGHKGVEREHAFVGAIPKTKVRLFSPSDLAARYDEQGLRIHVNKAKDEVERAAKAAGIPTTVVLIGNFAEFALNTLGVGVDVEGNRIIYTANSAKEKLNLCTREYVAVAYVSIFANKPISEIRDREITLTELAPTGEEIAAALRERHNKPPHIFHHSLEKINSETENGLRSGSPFTLSWYCRKIWGTGEQSKMVGKDRWDVWGYKKATLPELIVDGKLSRYKEFPPVVNEHFEKSFAQQ